MKRIRLGLLMAVGLAMSAAIHSGASAQDTHPEVLRHYRFVTHHSVLQQNWIGLEPPDVQYPVYGTFDVAFGDSHDDTWAGQSAKFVNVHAFAGNPLTASAPIDVNQVLNLSGLVGHQLPVAAPFDVFKFEGKAHDGSAVNLFADVIGHWFTLNGGTTLPDGHKFGVEYQIHALARERPFADFNDDGVVDQHDLDTLGGHFGEQPLVDDATAMGDADGDHAIGGADFLTWQNQLGETPPAVALADLTAGARTVPEPGSLLLVLAGATLAAAARRR